MSRLTGKVVNVCVSDDADLVPRRQTNMATKTSGAAKCTGAINVFER